MYSKFSIFNQGQKSVGEHGEGQRLDFVRAAAVIPLLAVVQHRALHMS